MLGRDRVDVEGLRGHRGCRCRCDSGRNLRLQVCLHLSCGIMGCKLGPRLAVIGRQGGSQRPRSPRPPSCSVTSAPIPRPISVRRRASAPGRRGRRRVRGRGGAPVRSRAGRLRSAVNAEHRAGGRRVTGTAGAPAEETPGGRLDTVAAGVVPLIMQPRRLRGRQGAIRAPASSATSGRS